MADKPTGILMCAILFAIGGVLSILIGFLGVSTISEFEEAPKIFTALSTILGVVFLIVGVAELVVAYGILNLNKWARTTGIVLAVISLINIPIGTIISIVILYFLLMNEETKNAFQ
ncbi:MAG: hypothetical protein CVT89_02095 [Candidatus Altiarchaeales archaeon HGW-Altiarchaeales-2]|nr:MAG: hypothetical protein CVT89_02095 [Candidatus Altiarchaeales archaeon HGW-Altiarchaeales-2]